MGKRDGRDKDKDKDRGSSSSDEFSTYFGKLYGYVFTIHKDAFYHYLDKTSTALFLSLTLASFFSSPPTTIQHNTTNNKHVI